jgi:hypothetical protein
LLSVAFTQPAPPRHSYDPKRDVTTYSTGDLRTGGLTGMAADFEFPGKRPKRPATVGMGFGHLRVPNDQDNLPPDTSLLLWKGVTEVKLQFGDTQLTLPAQEGWRVSTRDAVLTFYGHAVEEHVDVNLTVDQFASLSAAPMFKVVIGKETRTIRGQSVAVLRRLAASIPPS